MGANMTKQEKQKFALTTIGLFFWLMGFGTQIELAPLLEKFKKPKGILLGASLQVLFLPAWTSMWIAIFGLKSTEAITFLMVSCAPGGTNSNVWCLITQSDLALSAAMTGFSTFVSAGAMPLNLYLWGKTLQGTTGKVPLVEIIVPAISVVLGTGSGMYLRVKCDFSERALKRISRLVAISGLVFVIIGMIYIYTEEAPSFDFSAGVWFLAIIMNGTSLIIGAAVGRLIGLSKPEAVSIGYEVSTQNLAIPLTIMVSAYTKAESRVMVSILFLFGVWSVVQNVIYMYVMVKLGWTNRVEKGFCLGEVEQARFEDSDDKAERRKSWQKSPGADVPLGSVHVSVSGGMNGKAAAT